MPSVLHGSEVWCLKEKIRILLNTERSMVRAMCGEQVNDRRIDKDLMLMFGMIRLPLG